MSFATSNSKVVVDGTCGQWKRELSKSGMSKNIVNSKSEYFFQCSNYILQVSYCFRMWEEASGGFNFKDLKRNKRLQIISDISSVHKIEIDKSLKC